MGQRGDSWRRSRLACHRTACKQAAATAAAASSAWRQEPGRYGDGHGPWLQLAGPAAAAKLRKGGCRRGGAVSLPSAGLADTAATAPVAASAAAGTVAAPMAGARQANPPGAAGAAVAAAAQSTAGCPSQGVMDTALVAGPPAGAGAPAGASHGPAVPASTARWSHQPVGHLCGGRRMVRGFFQKCSKRQLF